MKHVFCQLLRPLKHIQILSVVAVMLFVALLFLSSFFPYAEATHSSDEWQSTQQGVVHYNGNVGIGTDTPTAKLHVEGIIRALEGFVSGFLNIRDGNYWDTNIHTHLKDRVFFFTHNTRKGMFFSAYGDDADIRFQTGNTWSDTPQRSLLLANNGKVGIGTITPSEKLDVAGGIAVNGKTVINSNGEWVGAVMPLPVGYWVPAAFDSSYQNACQTTCAQNGLLSAADVNGNVCKSIFNTIGTSVLRTVTNNSGEIIYRQFCKGSFTQELGQCHCVQG